MASSTLVADNLLSVPDWVRRNGEIFRTPPEGTDLSKRRRSFEGSVERKQDVARAAGGHAARSLAEMSEDDGLGTIDPPALLPPASFYEDVRNHANIASTMLVTARRAVGFEPSLAGQQLSAQQMNDFNDKSYKWYLELYNYWPYIAKMDIKSTALGFHSGNENLINEDVSKFLARFSGLRDEVVQAWSQSLTGMVKGAAAYVTEHGADVSLVSFQMDVLDTAGSKDPVVALTFGHTLQSDGKSDSVFTDALTYVVNSRAIIRSADEFAEKGISTFGVKEYCAYVNSGN